MKEQKEATETVARVEELEYVVGRIIDLLEAAVTQRSSYAGRAEHALSLCRFALPHYEPPPLYKPRRRDLLSALSDFWNRGF